MHATNYKHFYKESSLVPSPTPSFPSLLSTVLSSDGKLGVGLGTRLQGEIMQSSKIIMITM